MYKDIKQHAELVVKHMQASSTADSASFYEYHLTRLRDFQHERLVHLLVTLFFGGLVITGVIALFLVSLGGMDHLIIGLLSAISGLLLVIELCYIWYYYLLENGVQRLSRLTPELYTRAVKSMHER